LAANERSFFGNRSWTFVICAVAPGDHWMVEDIEDRAHSALNPSITTRIGRAGDIQAALA
jgi:hypothetical protein